MTPTTLTLFCPDNACAGEVSFDVPPLEQITHERKTYLLPRPPKRPYLRCAKCSSDIDGSVSVRKLRHPEPGVVPLAIVVNTHLASEVVG
jgi:hypothetical protein